jgi:hypothetical protein
VLVLLRLPLRLYLPTYLPTYLLPSFSSLVNSPLNVGRGQNNHLLCCRYYTAYVLFLTLTLQCLYLDFPCISISLLIFIDGSIYISIYSSIHISIYISINIFRDLPFLYILLFHSLTH